MSADQKEQNKDVLSRFVLVFMLISLSSIYIFFKSHVSCSFLLRLVSVNRILSSAKSDPSPFPAEQLKEVCFYVNVVQEHFTVLVCNQFS